MLAGPREAKTSSVKLVKSEQITARSGVVLWLTMDATVEPGGSFYFRPCMSNSVLIEEAVVDVEGGELKLPVLNLSDEAMELGKEQELGYVTKTRTDGGGDLHVDIDETKEEGTITMVTTEEHTPLTAEERREKLRCMLDKDGVAVPQMILECALKYHGVFLLEEMEKGSVEGVEHTIDTGDSKPIKEAAKQVPFALREKISEMVKEMLKGGIISESSSPWASPVVILRKKDGSLCFCVDYRQLNVVTKKDVFPLPCIDDLLDQLRGKCVLSTFDTQRGYRQIPINVKSTAFITHEGLFKFDAMPFGFSNTPATFQRLMQKILSGLGSFCNVYIEEL